jgi:CheY-like chemotaxis protein
MTVDQPSRILVVEDDPTNLLLLRAVLARASDPRLSGAVITEANTLQAAYQAAAARDHDLIILDVRLPDGNGLDLARAIRARPSAKRPKILILSASVLTAERDLALAAGGDEFVAKPYLPHDLQAACEQLLRMASAAT